MSFSVNNPGSPAFLFTKARKRAYNFGTAGFLPRQKRSLRVKTSTALLVSLAFANGALAQTPAPDREPIQLAQAGGAARGAGLPAARGGATSAVIAVIAIAVAGAAAAATNNSTVNTPQTTTPAHH